MKHSWRRLSLAERGSRYRWLAGCTLCGLRKGVLRASYNPNRVMDSLFGDESGQPIARGKLPVCKPGAYRCPISEHPQMVEHW